MGQPVELGSISAERLGRLVDVSRELAALRTLEDLRDVVARAARDLVGSDGATLVIADGDDCFYVGEDAIAPLFRGQHFPMDRCISGWVMRHNEPAVIADIDHDDRIEGVYYASTFVRTLSMTPVTSGDEAVAAIGTYWADRYEATPDDLALLRALADITATTLHNIRLNDELAHQLLYDRLTGLPNRHLLVDHLHEALSRLHTARGAVLLLLIDLHNFKVVNDSAGHSVGDELLVLVASRLAEVTQPGDTLSRLSGDQFAVVRNASAGAEEAASAIARQVAEVFDRPFEVDGRRLFTSAAIGVATTDDPDETAGDVLRHAEGALFQAKRRGPASVEFADEELRARVTRRLDIENALREGIDGDELRLAFQPIVGITDRGGHGVEALVRWLHDDELLAPGSFIHIAEETGLILPLGRWVLTEALRQVGDWNRAHPDGPIEAHVNLSAREFGDPRLARIVDEALRQTGAEPPLVCLELTESVLLEDPEQAVGICHELRALGVQLAVDDFGTGYSSLAYLVNLPVDVLKIDKSFVDLLGTSRRADAVVRAIATMGETVDMAIVAEGIETEEQAGILEAIGCELGQGYLYGKPTLELATAITGRSA